MSTLYPPLDPYDQGHLDVGDGHAIYYEVSGNPSGVPAIFVHGGPGGGTAPAARRYWDPTYYRIVLMDQRGCGQSTPHASLVANTTSHLIADMERLREHLEIERWQLFGGSWGSTLAIAYAEAHPDRVSELVLRGIFLATAEEVDWYYRGGAARFFPDKWETFLSPLDEEERKGDLVAAYYRRLTSDDAEVRREAARTWSYWEVSTSRLVEDAELVAKSDDDNFAAAFARIECHYFMNDAFMEPNQLLRNIGKIAHLPATIVQGRYDVICPPLTAWRLHRAWPGSTLQFVADAGHSAREDGTEEALVAATDRYRR